MMMTKILKKIARKVKKILKNKIKIPIKRKKITVILNKNKKMKMKMKVKKKILFLNKKIIIIL